MSCCPTSSIGYLSAGDYIQKGSIINLPSDVFGWNCGRVRAIADALANQGYFILIPQLLAPLNGGTDGEGFPPDYDVPAAKLNGEFARHVKANVWCNIEPKVKDTLEFIKSKNIDNIGAFGFCWGAFNLCHAFDLHQFKCACLFHPSILAALNFGENPSELATKIISPVLSVPGCNDGDEYRPNGEYYSKWNNPEFFKVPDNVKHGYFIRGDISDPIMLKTVNETFETVVDFCNRKM